MARSRFDILSNLVPKTESGHPINELYTLPRQRLISSRKDLTTPCGIRRCPHFLWISLWRTSLPSKFARQKTSRPQIAQKLRIDDSYIEINQLASFMSY